MSIDTIQRAFSPRSPQKTPIGPLNELQSTNLFSPEKIVARAQERATEPYWVEKLINYLASLFGNSREAQRRKEASDALIGIKRNYNNADPVLHCHGDYQIERDGHGRIVLYQFILQLKYIYPNSDFAYGNSVLGDAWAISDMNPVDLFSRLFYQDTAGIDIDNYLYCTQEITVKRKATVLLDGKNFLDFMRANDII